MKKLFTVSMTILVFFAMLIRLEDKAFANGNTFETISSGSEMSSVIKADASLWAWGYNGGGKLGDGTTINQAKPIKIMNDISSVSSCGTTTMVIKTDDSLWGWGLNTNGQLGDGTTNDRSKPIKIMDNVSSVSTTFRTTMAIKTDGSLWGWGSNSEGQLGNGSTNDSTTPIKIMDNVSSVSVSNSTMAIKTDGSLWAWGRNTSGQFGNGKTDGSRTPIKIMDGVSSVSVSNSTMVIKTDGSLWAWGNNTWGQLGNGKSHQGNYNFVDGIDSTTPIKIMDNVSSVSSGGTYTMAIKTDGSLWAWGHNANGQLGNGTTNSYTKPIKIMDNVSSVSAGGDEHCLAIKADGSLWTWGRNMYGQLGNGKSGHNISLIPEKIMDSVMLPSHTTTTLSNVLPVTEKSIKVTIDGKPVLLDQPPIIQNNRTLVPMRSIFEAMGATVNWDNTTQTATAQKGNTIVSIQINNRILIKNGQRITLDIPAQIVNGRTLVPTRAVTEALGATVNWDNITQTVIVTTISIPTSTENIKIDNTFTTTFGKVNSITYPSFAFDYPNSWNIYKNEVTQDRETVTLKNDRGVKITYTHLSGSLSGGGSSVLMLSVDVSKVADSNFIPGYVQATDRSNLGKFMVAKLKVTGTLDMKTDSDFSAVDGSTAYAVIPVSRIGTDSVTKPYMAEYSFNYSGNISFISESPDGKFTKAEEQEIIAILQSFRLNSNG